MIDIQAMPTWFPRNGRLCPYVWETSSARGGVGPRLNVSNSRGTVTLCAYRYCAYRYQVPTSCTENRSRRHTRE